MRGGVQADVAAIGLFAAGEDAQQGGFPAAVGAGQTDALARPHLERHPVQERLGAEVLPQPFHAQEDHPRMFVLSIRLVDAWNRHGVVAVFVGQGGRIGVQGKPLRHFARPLGHRVVPAHNLAGIGGHAAQHGRHAAGGGVPAVVELGAVRMALIRSTCSWW